ncbi:MAG: YhdH/YhfP family quinone oxidoreductase [Bdellovibrionales bacterium]
MKTCRAFRIHNVGGKVHAQLQDVNLKDLTPGDVLIAVNYSSVNYKDALAATGKGKILRRFPLNGGIDAAGVVTESSDPRFSPGQKVLVTGCGLSETYDGGYSEIMSAKAESVVPLPQGLTSREAMLLGTAGFTAALALHRMEQNGQTAALGPILVTGATGGVGSFAIQLFAQAGYTVVAVSGKAAASPYLQALGASEILTPEALDLGDRPLESIRFGGAVDNVGGKLLAKVLAHTELWGNVASIGLAAGHELHTTVMPFILRGVSLLGISSNNTPMSKRHWLWKQLAGPWKPKSLESILARTVSLNELPAAFEDLLNRQIQGRILVEIRRDE